jgi:hypothetical protein
MDVVNDLLVSARLDAPDLYRTWTVVSLAKFASDGQIEVRTRDGVKILFGTEEKFFVQIARLFTVLEKVSANPQARSALREIDLSLGHRPSAGKEVDVPVVFASETSGAAAAHGSKVGAASHPRVSQEKGMAPRTGGEPVLSAASAPAPPKASSFSKFQIHFP